MVSAAFWSIRTDPSKVFFFAADLPWLPSVMALCPLHAKSSEGEVQATAQATAAARVFILIPASQRCFAAKRNEKGKHMQWALP